MPWHQVPMVLLGPTGRTVIPCGYHHSRCTWLDITHGTWDIVIEKFPREWIKRRTDLIFRAIHERVMLKPVLVLVVLWEVWQAKELTTTAIMVVVTASSKTCKSLNLFRNSAFHLKIVYFHLWFLYGDSSAFNFSLRIRCYVWKVLYLMNSFISMTRLVDSVTDIVRKN